MDRILLVEDDNSLREVLTSVLEGEGFSVDAFPSAEQALECVGRHPYVCILADFKLPGRNGLELLASVRELSTTVPFVMMTAFGSVDIAVRAMKGGANDFITKPFEPGRLSTVIREVIEHRRIIDRTLGLRTRRERTFLTESPEAQHLLQQARKAARVDTSILILGESGTGKELIARHIHEHSPRADKPFIAVNCAAIPPDLLESDLFGHEAGAFTGATQTRVGIFELAAEGTIFLDEVGDMPPALQVKLLRALQEREIKRVGGTRIIRTNPRVLTATNQNIEEALTSGRLRDDFYYRIAVISLSIPPLRERIGDIALLTNYFVDWFCTAIGREPIKISRSAQEVLRTYRWPGNARELENVIERAVILAEEVIAPEHLGLNLNVDLTALAETSISLPEIAQRAARKAEVELIEKTLQQTRGNKSRAAEILGVSYKTLLNKVREYEIGAPSASADPAGAASTNRP